MSENAFPESHLFDRNLLHGEAAAALDRNGLELLGVKESGEVPNFEPPFPSRRQSSATITDADIIGEPTLAWSDLSGRIVGRYFMQNGSYVALREAGYKQLQLLVEQVLRTKPFSRVLSPAFVEEQAFRWWRSSLRGECKTSLSSYLLDAAEMAVARHTIIVPLTNIEIEGPFKLGEILVTPLDALPFEQFGEEAIQNHPERAADVRAARADLKKEYAHLTGVQTTVVGDIELARESARQIAFDMADVLRLMSPAAATWNIVFQCLPHGCEHEPSTSVLEMRGEQLGTVSSGLLHHGLFRWKLTLADLDTLMSLGFRGCAAFFSGRELTGFEKRVKTALSAYSRGIASHDQRDRLLYAMSAAEHLLLRNANEPIQSGVGDRIAFLVAKEAGERQQVAANFRKAYGLRSRQVHHLATVGDVETLTAFYRNLWVMMLSAITNMHRYKEHLDFLNALDKMKYS